MSVDYHGRVDFRAFDVMVEAIHGASDDDLDAALETAREFSDPQIGYTNESNRAIWGLFANLLEEALDLRDRG